MNILLIHASAGAGHRRAAEALAEAFGRRGAQADVWDILDDTPPWFRRTYARGYLHLVRAAPELWGYMYARTHRTAQRPWDRRLRLIFSRINALSFARRYRRARPEAVICTHFLPLELLSAGVAGSRGAPLYGVVTDFDVHALWSSRPVAGYFVATEEARRQLIRRGQPPETVRVTGIPVARAFAPSGLQAAARRRYGLDPRRPVALFLAGGFGVGPAVEFARSIARDAPGIQALVVVGQNDRLRRSVAAAAAGGERIRVFGYVDTIPEMMEAADLVVTKPGGLTCSEALAKGRPLVLVDPIPGHEQRNGEYLLETGAAARLFEARDAAFKLTALFQETGRLQRMAHCARAIGRPRAADDIAGLVLAALSGRAASRGVAEPAVAG